MRLVVFNFSNGWYSLFLNYVLRQPTASTVALRIRLTDRKIITGEFTVSKYKNWYFQDPDAVVVQLDPADHGLLSFQTFCQGVATMLETNLPTPAATVRANNGEIILSELHLSPLTNRPVLLTLQLWSEIVIMLRSSHTFTHSVCKSYIFTRQWGTME